MYSHISSFVTKVFFRRQIETVRISFDGGTTSMNFAEAALLIQGSTCIYSKKIEFLYALVFQTLDVLSSKKLVTFNLHLRLNSQPKSHGM